MPANHYTPWTTKLEMELIALWAQEPQISAEKIGAKLGFSRNAILGKVFRLRLAKRTNRNRHFYTAPCDRQPPKRPVNKSVFPTREQKPALYVPKPNFKPALISVTSSLTGVIISIKRRPHVPEMTKPELRAMLAMAMLNTARLQ